MTTQKLLTMKKLSEIKNELLSTKGFVSAEADDASKKVYEFCKKNRWANNFDAFSIVCIMAEVGKRKVYILSDNTNSLVAMSYFADGSPYIIAQTHGGNWGLIKTL